MSNNVRKLTFKVAYHNANTGRPLVIYFKAEFKNFETALEWVRKKREELKKLQKSQSPHVTRRSNIWLEDERYEIPSWACVDFLSNPENASIPYILTIPPSQTAQC